MLRGSFIFPVSLYDIRLCVFAQLSKQLQILIAFHETRLVVRNIHTVHTREHDLTSTTKLHTMLNYQAKAGMPLAKSGTVHSSSRHMVDHKAFLCTEPELAQKGHIGIRELIFQSCSYHHAAVHGLL